MGKQQKKWKDDKTKVQPEGKACAIKDTKTKTSADTKEEKN